MSDQLHRLYRLKIDFSGEKESDLKPLQDRFSLLIRSRLTADIEYVLSELIPPNQFIEVESLYLDLGTISAERMEQEIPKKLQRALRDALSLYLGGDEPPTVGKGLPKELELLRHFLLTGAFPWWASSFASVEPESLMEEALGNSGDELAGLIREIARQKLGRERMRQVFSDSILEKVVVAVSPQTQGVGPDLIQVMSGIDALKTENERFEKLIRGIVWNEILISTSGNSRISDIGKIARIAFQKVASLLKGDHDKFARQVRTRVKQSTSNLSEPLIKALASAADEFLQNEAVGGDYSEQEETPPSSESWARNITENWSTKRDETIQRIREKLAEPEVERLGIAHFTAHFLIDVFRYTRPKVYLEIQNLGSVGEIADQLVNLRVIRKGSFTNDILSLNEAILKAALSSTLKTAEVVSESTRAESVTGGADDHRIVEAAQHSPWEQTDGRTNELSDLVFSGDPKEELTQFHQQTAPQQSDPDFWAELLERMWEVDPMQALAMVRELPFSGVDGDAHLAAISKELRMELMTAFYPAAASLLSSFEIDFLDLASMGVIPGWNESEIAEEIGVQYLQILSSPVGAAQSVEGVLAALIEVLAQRVGSRPDDFVEAIVSNVKGMSDVIRYVPLLIQFSQFQAGNHSFGEADEGYVSETDVQQLKILSSRFSSQKTGDAVLKLFVEELAYRTGKDGVELLEKLVASLRDTQTSMEGEDPLIGSLVRIQRIEGRSVEPEEPTALAKASDHSPPPDWAEFVSLVESDYPEIASFISTWIEDFYLFYKRLKPASAGVRFGLEGIRSIAWRCSSRLWPHHVSWNALTHSVVLEIASEIGVSPKSLVSEIESIALRRPELEFQSPQFFSNWQKFASQFLSSTSRVEELAAEEAEEREGGKSMDAHTELFPVLETSSEETDDDEELRSSSVDFGEKFELIQQFLETGTLPNGVTISDAHVAARELIENGPIDFTVWFRSMISNKRFIERLVSSLPPSLVADFADFLTPSAAFYAKAVRARLIRAGFATERDAAQRRRFWIFAISILATDFRGIYTPHRFVSLLLCSAADAESHFSAVDLDSLEYWSQLASASGEVNVRGEGVVNEVIRLAILSESRTDRKEEAKGRSSYASSSAALDMFAIYQCVQPGLTVANERWLSIVGGFDQQVSKDRVTALRQLLERWAKAESKGIEDLLSIVWPHVQELRAVFRNAWIGFELRRLFVEFVPPKPIRMPDVPGMRPMPVVTEVLEEPEREENMDSSEKMPPVGVDEGQIVVVRNAGLVIFHPYIGMLFERAELMENGAFVDEDARIKAIFLLQLLATGSSFAPEYELPLNKILCGYPIDAPLPDGVEAEESWAELCSGLIEAVIAHWAALKNTAPDAFISSFVLREGSLTYEEKEGWNLEVVEESYDLLIGTLPWSLSTIHLSWLSQPIHVKWK